MSGKRLSRQEAERRGQRAESRAALWLTLRGYRIVARNLKTPVSEIDILAVRGNLLAMVEVKSRPTLQGCEDALNWSTRRRLDAAADWLDAHSPFMTRRNGRRRDLRTDAVFIVGRRVHHRLNAWRYGD